jgi:EAL domain-containing protein (putative c-di-GMP-specific phosphodiesterase class I)
MAVNVTSRQLTQPGYVHQVLAACRRHAIAPQRVRLELTETMVMADPAAAIRALEELRAQGVAAVLDDFGVGYSSMAYLQRLPLDVLKIDRGFVAGLPSDTDDRAIVGLVVGLAEAMHLEVTAEGIETDEQRLALLELGCRLGQGFYFSRPVDAATIGRLLADRAHQSA